MTAREDEADDLAERDRQSVMGCEHGVLLLERDELSRARNGRVWVDDLTCMTCPSRLLYVQYEDPRDDVEMKSGIWG